QALLLGSLFSCFREFVFMLEPCKGNHTLRRGRLDGCAFSLVDKNGVDLFYGLASATKGDDTRKQIFSAFENLEKAMEEVDVCAPVKLDIFLREIGDKQLVRAIMSEMWGDYLVPATTFIAQKPCDESKAIVIEAIAVNPSDDETSTPVSVYNQGEHATILEYGGVSLGFFGGFIPGEETVGAYARSFDAFAKMRAEVESNGFLFPQVYRTWLYQGHIVLEEGDTQRYKELNRARSDFFYGTRFIERWLPKGVPHGTLYPASTGIGADDVDIAMSCQTFQSDREGALVVPIENPNQTPAFDYAEFYSPKSPKFSRACAVSYNDRCSVYVSGTASIVDQKTVFIGDPAGQTNQTLDNIAALISGDNLKRHGIDRFGAELSDLALARVYVKRPEYFDAVRGVCEKRLPGVPLVYTYADVCRDDLLVEVEGIASCKE
ncbi:MAG: hypothetical protein ACI4QC_08180, partial [Thermoguttaceae bacterium]